MAVNKAETAELLTFTAAFDQRTIGRADVEAWAIALADVPWDDTTRTAVANFYSSPAYAGDPGGEAQRRFMQPHQLVAARARIRKDRIERLPMPCPNSIPGVSEGDELRAIAKAIGDGAITTRAELAAYERWGGSLHLAQQSGGFPALDGPEPVVNELGQQRVLEAIAPTFRRVPRVQ